MTATKPRSAGERLQAAKAALPKLERERDAVMARRRDCLLNDDVAGRRRCDYQLRELGDDLQAAHDKVGLLASPGPVVVQEQTGWTWPSSLPEAWAALLEVEPQIVRLQSVPKVDRSAAHDAALDHLIKRQYSLTKLIQSLRPKETAA